jgi:hypothetical protein
MYTRRRELALALMVVGFGFSGCAGDQPGSTQTGSGGNGSGSRGGSISGGGGSGGVATGSGGGGPGGSGGAGAGSGGGVTGTGSTTGSGGGPADPNARLPARVRRMTNVEFDASVRALLGTTDSPAVTSFPPDSRQKLGYTLNDAQIVASVMARQLDSSAQALVAAARSAGRFTTLAPCSSPTTQGETCARAFITSFGEKAYRRPLTAEDSDPLVALYRAGLADGGNHNEGIDLVARAIVQSPNFLYLTELGEGGAPGAKVTLTGHEMASALAYLVSAAPPDAQLLAAAAAGQLADPAVRDTHVRRLLGAAPARDRLVRVVREWLGIDGIAQIAKDAAVYPNFAGHRNAMAAESLSFVREVLVSSSASVSELLGADWSIVDTTQGATSQEASSYFSSFYGVGSTATGRRPLAAASGGAGRLGILNQGAFLSVFAHAHQSAPVLRGVAVMRRVACIEVRDPVELNIVVVPPVPDPAIPKTTRDLFSVHATDTLCKTCHTFIDNFGFAFEGYDGMGAFRTGRRETVKTTSGTTELPINTSVTVAGTGTDLDGSYADSNALATALAGSDAVRSCMARQMFRASVGRSDNSVAAVESAFVGAWRALPASQQGNILETVVAYVKSPLFSERRIPQ